MVWYWCALLRLRPNQNERDKHNRLTCDVHIMSGTYHTDMCELVLFQ